MLKDSSGSSFLGEVTGLEFPFSNIAVYSQSEYIDAAGTHGLQNFGKNIVCTGSTSGTFSAALGANIANGANVGVFPTTTAQRLIFYIMVS